MARLSSARQRVGACRHFPVAFISTRNDLAGNLEREVPWIITLKVNVAKGKASVTSAHSWQSIVFPAAFSPWSLVNNLTESPPVIEHPLRVCYLFFLGPERCRFRTRQAGFSLAPMDHHQVSPCMAKDSCMCRYNQPGKVPCIAARHQQEWGQHGAALVLELWGCVLFTVPPSTVTKACLPAATVCSAADAHHC